MPQPRVSRFRRAALKREIRRTALRALVLFGVLFVIVHLPNPGLDRQTFVLALANLFLASVLLGLCWLRAGSLALPIKFLASLSLVLIHPIEVGRWDATVNHEIVSTGFPTNSIVCPPDPHN